MCVCRNRRNILSFITKLSELLEQSFQNELRMAYIVNIRSTLVLGVRLSSVQAYLQAKRIYQYYQPVQGSVSFLTLVGITIISSIGGTSRHYFSEGRDSQQWHMKLQLFRC